MPSQHCRSSVRGPGKQCLETFCVTTVATTNSAPARPGGLAAGCWCHLTLTASLSLYFLILDVVAFLPPSVSWPFPRSPDAEAPSPFGSVPGTLTAQPGVWVSKMVTLRRPCSQFMGLRSPW